ncbi:MAG TPA: winged helix-turn-helix transcriptional regulator [Candidatus Dormibacteraeota bacterium]|nr:winged helix-turn-helix transcriptional regulator [Candidatus Dormibacteraeota bacterium]
MARGYGQECPIARTLEMLGEKWTLLVVRELFQGTNRFKDLVERLHGIPRNLLAQRLAQLETEGLVVRRSFREVPPRVEYHLTEKGWSLQPVLRSLADWGKRWNVCGVDGAHHEHDPLAERLLSLPFEYDLAAAQGAREAVEIRAGSRAWFVTFENGGCLVGRSVDEPPSAILAGTESAWLDVLGGRSELAEAERTGKIAIDGDRRTVDRFHRACLRPLALLTA